MSSSLIRHGGRHLIPLVHADFWSSTFQAETTPKMSADSERRRSGGVKMIAILILSPLSREDMGLNLHLSDWEHRQRGLVIPRKHGNALTEANVLCVSISCLTVVLLMQRVSQKKWVKGKLRP